jgi:hypothetical protein
MMTTDILDRIRAARSEADHWRAVAHALALQIVSHGGHADATESLRRMADSTDRRADQYAAGGESRLAETVRASAAEDRAAADLVDCAAEQLTRARQGAA